MLHVNINDSQNNNEIKQSKPLIDFGKNKITRKQFFRRIGLISLIPFVSVWYSTAEKQFVKESRSRNIVIPASSITQGISFHDSIVISKDKNDIKIFSAHCTHLGCLLNKTENGAIVCPCHGSHFSANGKVLKGPADKSLQLLKFKLNSKTGDITVNVPA